MTAFRSLHRFGIGLIASMILLLTSCAKEELVAPAGAPVAGKSLSTTLQSGSTENGSTDVRDSAGDGGWISDDGDDVGDGERNRKKKPTN